MKKSIIILFLFFSVYQLFCQGENIDNVNNKSIPKYFVSIGLGTQMSGWKSEDFIKSNFSPVVDLSAGRWFSPEIAIQLGYTGWYFNTISNPDKRHYAYFYGEAVFNITEIIKSLSNPKWNLNINLGSGYFYNFYYDRPNICANIGFSYQYHISSRLFTFINISSIMGWDIYQNNADILPNSKIGLTYFF